MPIAWLIAPFVESAAACSIAPPAPFVVTEDPSDTTPPPAPSRVHVEVTRGKGPLRCGDQVATTSCDDIGWLRLTFVQPGGDADALGYRVRHVAGELPDGLRWPADTAWKGPEVWFTWIDGNTFEQDAFAFTVEVTAVDAAGNVGEPLKVEITDDGQAPPEERVLPDCVEASTGCRAVPTSAAGPWWWTPLWLARRRRRG